MNIWIFAVRFDNSYLILRHGIEKILETYRKLRTTNEGHDGNELNRSSYTSPTEWFIRVYINYMYQCLGSFHQV